MTVTPTFTPGPMIPTLRQFAEAQLREIAVEHGISLAAARREYEEYLSTTEIHGHWRSEWWDRVQALFNDGHDFSPREWRALAPRSQHWLLRLSRAQRDDAVMKHYVDLLPVGWLRAA